MTIQKAISRRDFLKYAGGGIAVLVVGSKLSWLAKNPAYAQAVPVQTLDFHITDAMKQMHTHNLVNKAECYFWIYKSNIPDLPPEFPGPAIMAAKGDSVEISITNDLDEPHAFYSPGITWEAGEGKYQGGVIAAGETVTGVFTASQCGAFLYYDNLNAPVNRMMGLHGAIIVLPTEAERAPGHNLTPYENPTPHVQELFDAFGTSVYPGLKWEEGDEATNVPPFRHYLWLSHEASPRLFAEVGEYFAIHGDVYPAQEFMDKFLRDTFHLNNNENAEDGSGNPQGIANISYRPQYFAFNGQSGFFSHLSSYVTPMGRVGEPAVVYILNAGLWQHSMHLHANHFYVTNINNVVQENPIWVDVFNIHPMDSVDYVIPFMRPPDVPNQRGIGRPDPARGTCWPPVEELDTFIPGFQNGIPAGTEWARPGASEPFYNAGGEIVFRPVLDGDGNPVLDINGDPVPGEEVELAQRLSPLCYPMHDHAEPSQTTQGGNYNTALISGIYFVGDRNTVMDFPTEEDWFHVFGTGDDRGCGRTGTHPAAPISDHMHPA